MKTDSNNISFFIINLNNPHTVIHFDENTMDAKKHFDTKEKKPQQSYV